LPDRAQYRRPGATLRGRAVTIGDTNAGVDAERGSARGDDKGCGEHIEEPLGHDVDARLERDAFGQDDKFVPTESAYVSVSRTAL